MKRKFVKVMFFGALALSTVTYVGCKDYDDDIDNLQTQIDANKASIADLQAKVNDGKWVKDVVKIEGGFKITFNNGDAYDIVNGKNGVTHKVEIKGGYWYIDDVKQIAATGLSIFKAALNSLIFFAVIEGIRFLIKGIDKLDL